MADTSPKTSPGNNFPPAGSIPQGLLSKSKKTLMNENPLRGLSVSGKSCKIMRMERILFELQIPHDLWPEMLGSLAASDMADTDCKVQTLQEYLRHVGQPVNVGNTKAQYIESIIRHWASVGDLHSVPPILKKVSHGETARASDNPRLQGRMLLATSTGPSLNLSPSQSSAGAGPPNPDASPNVPYSDAPYSDTSSLDTSHPEEQVRTPPIRSAAQGSRPGTLSPRMSVLTDPEQLRHMADLERTLGIDPGGQPQEMRQSDLDLSNLQPAAYQPGILGFGEYQPSNKAEKPVHEKLGSAALQQTSYPPNPQGLERSSQEEEDWTLQQHHPNGPSVLPATRQPVNSPISIHKLARQNLATALCPTQPLFPARYIQHSGNGTLALTKV
ncbi:hypothetical protein NUW58_g10419 [Xylaria curta]|uniref:Uncharacterized protein n=1 Tax=Xylaria curta TaxID=42375 RepID=A0ACC1MMR0_9PEZI|nr:hypothetical protein NUW58_g10419 [Xylaria curta]